MDMVCSCQITVRGMRSGTLRAAFFVPARALREPARRGHAFVADTTSLQSLQVLPKTEFCSDRNSVHAAQRVNRARATFDFYAIKRSTTASDEILSESVGM